MGSATTQALAATEAAFNATTIGDLGTARELFAAARAVGESSQLSGALADFSAPAAARAALVDAVFSDLGAPSAALLHTAVAQRWSKPGDLVAGIEQLAVRAAAQADTSVDVEGELFRFSRTIADHPDLELALNSRLGAAAPKGALADTLLANHASEATTLIVSSLVQQPRERRVRQLLSDAMTVVANQRGRIVAQVFAAAPLSTDQADRLAAVLSGRYGAQVTLNSVIDPDLVGGLRVQIGDDVIDASVASRLHDLRQRLAG